MVPDDGLPDPEAGHGRVRRLYDRLAALLKRLPQDRREAFADHLQSELEAESGQERGEVDQPDDHGPTQAGDRR